MAIKHGHGDMFSTPAKVRVNAVNCVGVMGAGVALAFKTRYPAMFLHYRAACARGDVSPGKLHIWSTADVCVVNVPTKKNWRDGSRYVYIEVGLLALRNYLGTLIDVRVTVPALGCGLGGLNWAHVLPMIEATLGDLEAEVFVFGPQGQ